jgi:hypothetical protein
MSLDYSHCPAADQNDEAKKSRTEEFFKITVYVNTPDADLTPLVAQGICLEARDKWGHTALIGAAYYGQTDTVQALLAAGAEIEARNNNGDTALYIAAYRGHTNTVQALLVAGAEIGARDNDGDTALIGAAGRSHTDTVRALLAAGAEIEARDKNGDTALSYAVRRGHSHTNTVQALLERGANIYVGRNNSARLIDYPIVKNHVQLWPQEYADFVTTKTPPKDAASVYRLLAVTPLLDEQAPVDRVANLTRIMAHANWANKHHAAAILTEMAQHGSITPEIALDIYQHHIATPLAQRTHSPDRGRGR